MSSTGAILLYHGTFTQVPSDLGGGLHNITPDVLSDHLEWVKRHYKIVDLSEYLIADRNDGLASVTIDDGYRCIVTEALPVFEAHNVPFTLFINGATLQGETFWRDKVRYIVEHDLIDEFEHFSGRIKRVNGKRFYRYSKHPSNNSAMVNEDIDKFFVDRGIQDAGSGYILTEQELVSHPLITYGNHSHHHYVMSSLSTDQQATQIQRTATLLSEHSRLSGLSVSDVFSIPFGDEQDFNDDTLGLVRDFGYKAVVLSRHKLDDQQRTRLGLRAIDRMMPKATNIGADLLVAAG